MKLYVAFFKHIREDNKIKYLINSIKDNKIKYLINSIKGNYYKNVLFLFKFNPFFLFFSQVF